MENKRTNQDFSSQLTIYNWCKRWESEGMVGLYNKPGRGCKRIFNSEQEEKSLKQRIIHMNWIIILSFCVPLLLALRNQHRELQKQQKVNKVLAQCVIQGIADCKQIVAELTYAASELESLKQKNKELAQQSVTSKQSLQVIGNQNKSQIYQELKNEITNLKQRLKSTNYENQSLKYDNAELRQQGTNLKQENNYFKEENKTLKANKKELEANKKALIQELGGAVGREDLEYATWDLVLQTTQLLVKERDEALKDNKSLQQNNHQLESQNASQKNDISHLKTEILKKESELNNLQRHQINSNDNHQLYSLQNQLLQKSDIIINLNKQLSESKQLIADLNKELQKKDTIAIAKAIKTYTRSSPFSGIAIALTYYAQTLQLRSSSKGHPIH